MHILHIVLQTAAYYLTYSAYFAYFNMQNMHNMNPAQFNCIFIAYSANCFAYHSILFDIFCIFCIFMHNLNPAQFYCIFYCVSCILFCILQHLIWHIQHILQVSICKICIIWTLHYFFAYYWAYSAYFSCILHWQHIICHTQHILHIAICKICWICSRSGVPALFVLHIIWHILHIICIYISINMQNNMQNPKINMQNSAE